MLRLLLPASFFLYAGPERVLTNCSNRRNQTLDDWQETLMSHAANRFAAAVMAARAYAFAWLCIHVYQARGAFWWVCKLCDRRQ